MASQTQNHARHQRPEMVAGARVHHSVKSYIAMKAVVTSILIALVTAAAADETAILEVRNLQDRIIAATPEGWDVSRSDSHLALTLKNARFRGTVGLPANADEDELWNRFSWKADFVIFIRFSPALTDDDYNALIQIREATERRKVADMTDPGFGFHGRIKNQLDDFLEETFPLPVRRMKDVSIWMHANNKLGTYIVRPSSAAEFETTVRALIEKTGTSYEDSEQATP